MDCRELERNELVEKYVSGHLDPALEDDFEIHLLECPRCQQAVEVLQNVAHDLAERAHEVRSQSSSRKAGFRWQWAAALPAVVIVGLVGGYYLVRAPKPDATAQNSQVALNSSVSAEVNERPSPAQAATSSASNTESHPEAVQHAVPAGAGNKQPPQVPSSPGAQSSQSSVVKSAAGKSAPQSVLPPTPSSEPNRPEIVSTPPSSEGSHSAVQSAEKAGSAQESEEVASERFRLGVVQPPAYTFSGFSGTKTRTGKGGKSDVFKTLNDGKPSQANLAIARGLFQKGMQAYVEGRYNTAADFLEQAVPADPSAPETNFFLGICKLMLSRPAEAVDPLKNALADEKSPYVQPAHYYLAKAYVQTNHLAEAEVEFRSAAATPGRLRTEANSMLSRVQALRAVLENQAAPSHP